MVSNLLVDLYPVDLSIWPFFFLFLFVLPFFSCYRMRSLDFSGEQVHVGALPLSVINVLCHVSAVAASVTKFCPFHDWCHCTRWACGSYCWSALLSGMIFLHVKWSWVSLQIYTYTIKHLKSFNVCVCHRVVFTSNSVSLQTFWSCFESARFTGFVIRGDVNSSARA